MAYNNQWSSTTQLLVNKLKTLKVWNLTTNKKEISVRCPICGDSYKNARSSHLYIKLDSEVHTYYCQRCKAKGVVTPDFLKQLKIYDSELNIAIGTELKNASLTRKNKNVNIVGKSNLKLPKPINDELSNKKLAYINNRLGLDLSLEDLYKLKIVPNLYDLLDENNIDFVTTKNQELADILDEHFLCMISYDNNYAICRNTSKTVIPDTRYYNYNIRNIYENSKRFYIIPTNIDLMQDKITVCITEGIFDILGVYHHIEKEHDNVIFAAVCGIGYNNVLQEIAKMGFLNLNIKFYSDTDQDLRMFKKIKSEFPFLSDTKCEVIYNTLDKDYGVSADKIKLKRSYI